MKLKLPEPPVREHSSDEEFEGDDADMSSDERERGRPCGSKGKPKNEPALAYYAAALSNIFKQ